MVDETLHPLERSLCKYCEHRVTREVSSEGFIITDDEGDTQEDLESFIHDACAILGIDLDHIVLDCNKFILTNDVYNVKKNFIRDNDILDKVN